MFYQMGILVLIDTKHNVTAFDPDPAKWPRGVLDHCPTTNSRVGGVIVLKKSKFNSNLQSPTYRRVLHCC